MTHEQILKQVEWTDLVNLSGTEKIIENSLSIPWILASWVAFYYEELFLGVLFDGFFFLAALRQVHNGFHNALGLTHRATEWVLHLNSALMFVSVHCVKFNHLRHHQYCMQEKDYEGKAAKMNGFFAILYGPIHIFHIHSVTIKNATRRFKKKVFIDVLCIALFLSITFYFNLTILKIHLIVMIISEFLMAFFAVWTVHHDTDESPLFARTQRVWWKNFISMNMFYHLEHHLFPAVPTIKLPELARRLDKVLPALPKKTTF